MKTLQNLSKILVVVLLGTLLVFAAKQTVEFEVKGACGMCETRIEKTAKSIDGVKKADWTLDDNVLILKFDDNKTSVLEVRKALAAVGHDNGDFRAPDDVYENLPACCHYERGEAEEKHDCKGNCGEEKKAHGEKGHECTEACEHEENAQSEKEHECKGNCSEEKKAHGEKEHECTGECEHEEGEHKQHKKHNK